MGRHRTVNLGLPPRMAVRGQRYYYVSSGKHRKWIPLGSDLAQAKRRWAEIDSPHAGGVTVGELVQRYIDREQRAASTAIQYKSYQKAINDGLPIPAAELTSQHVALWRELQRNRKQFCNGCLSVLVAAFRLGNELGLCKIITVGKWPQSNRQRVLTPAEFRAIRERAKPWLRTLMDLGYLTSQRPSDLLALRWAQIGERISIQQIKTRRMLSISVTPDIAAVLAEARARPVIGLYVVANDKGRRISRQTANDAWIAARTAAGVVDAQFRDIRAMAASASEREGGDYQALLGHTSLAMSERYLKGRRVINAEPVRKKL